MNTNTMIALVGEQPIPILLPILHENRFGQVNQVVLVCSTRTKPVGERLKTLLQKRLFPVGNNIVEVLCVEPYDILKAENELTKFISERKFDKKSIIFNLTGGTKSMALAAYSIALQSSRPFLYFQSEGKSLLHSYNFAEGGELAYKPIEIPPLLDIDSYLYAYLAEGYKPKGKNLMDSMDRGDRFEKVVVEVLSNALCALPPKLDEIKTSITFKGIAGEIDLVLRYGNNIGIAEVKSGKKARSKEGIVQLNTVAESRFLGTYAKKILITDTGTDKDTTDADRHLPENISELAKAHRIEVIELPSFSGSGGNDLSKSDKEKLVTDVIKILGG